MFTKEQYRQIENNWREIETINCESRKGVPQCKYVIEVMAGTYYTDDVTWTDKPVEKEVDEELIGVWILEDPIDPHWYSVNDCLKDDDWEPAREVQVTTWVGTRL